MSSKIDFFSLVGVRFNTILTFNRTASNKTNGFDGIVLLNTETGRNILIGIPHSLNSLTYGNLRIEMFQGGNQKVNEIPFNCEIPLHEIKSVQIGYSDAGFYAAIDYNETGVSIVDIQKRLQVKFDAVNELGNPVIPSTESLVILNPLTSDFMGVVEKEILKLEFPLATPKSAAPKFTKATTTRKR